MLALVALAGALGALGRYAVHGLVQSRTASRFPYGTVVVNVTGSFALGLVVGLLTYQGLDPDVRTVVGTGFIGAYTTFSSFSYDTFGLFEAGASRAALVNALGSIAVGLVAATAGFALAGLLSSAAGQAAEASAASAAPSWSTRATATMRSSIETPTDTSGMSTRRPNVWPRAATGISAPSPGSVNSPPIQRRCAPSTAPVRSIRGSVEVNGGGLVAALDERQQLDEFVRHGVEHPIGGRPGATSSAVRRSIWISSPRAKRRAPGVAG